MQKRKKHYGENKYDKVMRENLERPSELLLNYFFPGEIVKVQPLVPRIRQVILEQEPDTLVLLKRKGRKEFILHWEFQTRNDPGMARRMASYDFMIHLKYGLEVISIVIYTGSEPVNMNTTVNFNGNYYHCRLIDIRDMDPELFLASGNSREVIFAILAGDDKCNRKLIIKEILIKLQTLLPDSESELKERLVSLEILSDLRSEEIQQLLIKEEQKMPIIYDIRKDLRYRQGVSEGRSEGISQGFSQGESHALLATARNMIKKGLDIQLIHEITSLPVAEIKKLQKKLGK